MKIWELVGGLIPLIALIAWIRWLLTPSPSSTWPRQKGIRITFLYTIPFFLVGLSGLGIANFAMSVGAPEEFETYVVGFPTLIMLVVMLIGFLYLVGVPTPPFLVPRWIRKQDREYRRMKRTARRRRWQDPKVKASEIRAAITVPIITVLIAAAIFFGFVGIGTVLF